MKYFVLWKEPNSDWEEISRGRALEIIGCNYNNAEEVLQCASAEFPIPCMFCYIKTDI